MKAQRPATSVKGSLLFAAGIGLIAALAAVGLRTGHAAPVKRKPQAKITYPKTTPADRKRSENNLKIIGLAMHNYHDAMGALPGATINSKDGKPLLSWRVAILPYIEEDTLYKEFHLDEAWDSAHNKKLVARMPKAYGLPGDKIKPAGHTYYRVFTGSDAAFPSPKGLAGALTLGRRLTGFADGTSNTLLVVEAGEAVPWTKPDELAYDAKKPLPKLGGLFREGFHVTVADGSTRFISKKIDEKLLRALITPAGGEVIDWEKVPLAKVGDE
jgi:hypothetical protein